MRNLAPPVRVAQCASRGEVPGLFKMTHGGARPGSGPKPKPRPPEAPVKPAVDGPRWYVYLSHPYGELRAARALGRMEYRVYLPMLAIKRQDPVIRTMFHKELVPRLARYAFVELGPTDPWVPIAECLDVSSMLRGANGRPAPVATREVELLQQDDAKMADLSNIWTGADSPVLPDVLERGSFVRVLDGVFTGQTGRVDTDDGLVTTVEVMMFGRLVLAKYQRQDVEPL